MSIYKSYNLVQLAEIYQILTLSTPSKKMERALKVIEDTILELVESMETYECTKTKRKK